MRNENLIITDIVRLIGIEKTAKELRYEVDSVYKIQQGKFDFTLEKLRAFISLAGEYQSDRMIPLLSEYLEHFTNPGGFYPIHKDAYEMGLAAYHNLRKWPNGMPRLFNCRVCSQPLQVEIDDGTTAFLRCKNAMCRAHREGR